MCTPQRRSCRFLIPTIAATIALTQPIVSLATPIHHPVLPSPSRSPKNQETKIQETKIQETKIQVTKIQVTGSTLIPATDIAQIVAPYENRSLTLAELRPVTEQLTQYYLDRGYLTSRAILIDQTLDASGIIQIRIIEGELESIEVQGTPKIKPSYIRDRLALADRKPLRSTDLEHQLRLLKLDPLFSQVEASLKEGTSLGKSILRVRVTENPTWSGKVSLDNDINPSVGSEKLELSGGTQNLTGNGDRLLVSYARSFSGGANLWNFQYQLPLNPMQGTLTAQFSPNRYQITEGLLRDLDIIGSSQTYDLTYRQPLVRSPKEEFALSFGFNHRNGETLISTFLANRTTTTTMSFGQDYLRHDRQGLWTARSTFTLGLPWLGANQGIEPDGNFFLWSGQLQRLQFLSSNHTLLTQLSWQLTPDSLPSNSQFSMGGVNRLRGYRQGIQNGDNGFAATIEDQIVIDRNPLGNPNLQLVPFFDLGLLWNSGVNTQIPITPNLFAGTGLSLRWKPSPQVSIQLDAALPLVKTPDRGNALQDTAIYFSTQYQF
jgi:hemolysin activation/secretion protein